MKKILLDGFREVLFIVIGIYLAFELGNWKEARDDRKLEKELMGNIQIGLNNDLSDLESNLEAHSRFLRNQHKSIEWLESTAPATDSVAAYFSEAHYATSMRHSRAAFDALKEFGMNKLSNDTLRNHIVYVYDVLFPAYEQMHGTYHQTLNKTLERGLVHFADWSFKKNEYLMKPLNLAALRADRPYLMHLKLLRRQNEIVLYEIASLQRHIKRVIGRIEKQK